MLISSLEHFILRVKEAPVRSQKPWTSKVAAGVRFLLGDTQGLTEIIS